MELSTSHRKLEKAECRMSQEGGGGVEKSTYFISPTTCSRGRALFRTTTKGELVDRGERSWLRKTGIGFKR